jgi:hypothetical protein
MKHFGDYMLERARDSCANPDKPTSFRAKDIYSDEFVIEKGASLGLKVSELNYVPCAFQHTGIHSSLLHKSERVEVRAMALSHLFPDEGKPILFRE